MDVETRFGHLLTPLRDLAENWAIDIAVELEEYLNELETLSVNVPIALVGEQRENDDKSGVLSLNFAEAALLIQGSACIYSKKVEYLHALIMSTLEALHSQKKKKHSLHIDNENFQSSPSNNDEFAEEELLPLDDLPTSDNVDCVDSLEPYAKLRQATLQLRLPLSLIEFSHDDKEGEKKFRISECTLHEKTGALLLECAEAAFIDSSEERLSNTRFGNPIELIRTERESMRAAEKIMAAELDFDEDHNDYDDWDGGVIEDQAGAQDKAASNENRLSLQHRQQQSIETAEGEDLILVPNRKNVTFAEKSLCNVHMIGGSEHLELDPLALLDPFEKAPKGRPFRKGKTYRTYDKNTLEDQTLVHSPTSLSALISSSPQCQAIASEIAKGSIKVPYHVEFSGIFLHCLETRRKRNRNLLRQEREAKEVERQKQAIRRAASTTLSTAATEIDQADDFHFDDGPDYDEYDSEGIDLADPNTDFTSLEWQNEALEPLSQPNLLQPLAHGQLKNYEEMCREYLDAYLKSADAFVHSSELGQRVRQWSDRLAPILEEEDNHPAFDIREYGTKMLESVAKREGKQREQLVEFEDAVQGAPVYEVCRFFLATLQLANNGNVCILPSNSAPCNDDSTTWGSMALKLLESAQSAPVDVLVENRQARLRQDELLRLDEFRQCELQIQSHAPSKDLHCEPTEEEQEELRSTDNKREMKVRRRKVLQQLNGERDGLNDRSSLSLKKLPGCGKKAAKSRFARS